jgi:hypothetical protein
LREYPLPRIDVHIPLVRTALDLFQKREQLVVRCGIRELGGSEER